MSVMSQKPVRWLLLLLAWTALFVGSANRSPAQDGEEGAAPAATKEAAPAAEGGSTHTQQSTLMWLIYTSGWIGAGLLIISIYFVAKVVQLFLELRPQVMAPDELMTQADALLQQRDYNGIYQLMKGSDTELGQLISTGLTALSSGLNEAREAVDRVAEAISVDMEKKISMLSVIGSLGPMIGLLGTLKGMIASFAVIAMSDQQLKPAEVAGGISEALVLTFEGVALSVPAIYFFALFKGRVASLMVNLTAQTDEFLRRVQSSAQSKSSAPKTERPA